MKKKLWEDQDSQKGQYTGESSSWGHETSQDDGKAVLHESVSTVVTCAYQLPKFINLSTCAHT